MIEISELNVSYGKKQILFDVSLQIQRGERIVFAGPNGAGKSTLMKAIAGLVPAGSGTVFLEGDNITKQPPHRRIEKGMGFLLQTGNIVPSLTVRENLLLGGFTRPGRDHEATMAEVLPVFPFLKKKLSKRAGLLSGGERQALAISMILMKKPKLLLLDEPSAGLSPRAAEQILACVSTAKEEMGIDTVCMVEHRLKESLPWASKLVVLVGGRIAHIADDPQRLFDTPHGLEQFYF